MSNIKIEILVFSPLLPSRIGGQEDSVPASHAAQPGSNPTMPFSLFFFFFKKKLFNVSARSGTSLNVLVLVRSKCIRTFRNVLERFKRFKVLNVSNVTERPGTFYTF